MHIHVAHLTLSSSMYILHLHYMICTCWVCCVALPWCLFDLACFFLPSHLSLKHVCFCAPCIVYYVPVQAEDTAELAVFRRQWQEELRCSRHTHHMRQEEREKEVLTVHPDMPCGCCYSHIDRCVNNFNRGMYTHTTITLLFRLLVNVLLFHEPHEILSVRITKLLLL